MALSGCRESLNDITPINYSLSVQITSPDAGERFDDVTSVVATVESDFEVEYVELKVDDRVVGIDEELPYECDWYVWFWAEDSLHTISATVTDEYGNSATSEEIEVKVDTACWREPTLIQPLDGDVIDEWGAFQFKWYPIEGAYGYVVLNQAGDTPYYIALDASCFWDGFYYCATKDTMVLNCYNEIIDMPNRSWILLVDSPGKRLSFEYSYSIYIDCTQFP
jgi:hypothetical protein